jgi:hypothetical protein
VDKVGTEKVSFWEKEEPVPIAETVSTVGEIAEAESTETQNTNEEKVLFNNIHDEI